MARLSVLNAALEGQLETEKLLEAESEVSSDAGMFSDLFKNLWIKEYEKKKQTEQPVEGGSSGGSDYSSSDSDDSGDDGDSGDGEGDSEDGDDFNFDMDEPEEGEEEPEEESDEKEESEESEATESFDFYTLRAVAPSLEALEAEFELLSKGMALEADGDGWGPAIWEGMKTVGSAMYVAGTALGWVGINVLWPGMKRLYKIVIYLGAKIVRYGYLSAKKVEKTADEFSVRTEKLRKDIETASLIVKQLSQNYAKHSGVEQIRIAAPYDNVKIINRIKIGEMVRPLETSEALKKFLLGWYSKISSDIQKDTMAINHVLHYGLEASINPVKTFGDSSMRQGLVKDERVTHDVQNGFVDALRYKEVFPGDMVYCCALPNGKSQTIEDVRAAYAASKCSFNMEPRSFKKIDQLDYMALTDVVKTLAQLSNLLDILEEQKSVYEQINKEKSSYLKKFKRFFLGLADYDKKINVEQSMLEYIYLRSVYIDNVYTVTARDIHFFTQKYISNVLTYVKSNLDKLSS